MQWVCTVPERLTWPTGNMWACPRAHGSSQDTCDPDTVVHKVSTKCCVLEGERPNIQLELLERFRGRKAPQRLWGYLTLHWVANIYSFFNSAKGFREAGPGRQREERYSGQEELHLEGREGSQGYEHHGSGQ